MNKNKIIKLRTGRIYIIKPDKTCGQRQSKERPAIFIGWKMIKHKRMYLFIQLGSTPINYYYNKEFFKHLNSFWNTMNRKGYLNIDISKYEHFRVVKSVYRNNIGDFIELPNKDKEKIKEIYLARIQNLEKIRLQKAKKYAVIGDFISAEKQLCLLKQIMPEKHDKLHPKSLVRKWKKQFDKI